MACREFERERVIAELGSEVCFGHRFGLCECIADRDDGHDAARRRSLKSLFGGGRTMRTIRRRSPCDIAAAPVAWGRLAGRAAVRRRRPLPRREPVIEVAAVIDHAAAELVEFRPAAEDAELGKSASADPEIMRGFGTAKPLVLGWLHDCTSRDAPGSGAECEGSTPLQSHLNGGSRWIFGVSRPISAANLTRQVK